MVQIGRRGTARRLFENFKKFFKKITEFGFQNSGPSFLRQCLLCIVKKIRLDSNKTDEGDRFWSFPYSDSGNGTAAAARRSAGYSDWSGGAAACSDWSSGAFRTGGIQNGEVQSGHKNQPACVYCLLLLNFFAHCITLFGFQVARTSINTCITWVSSSSVFFCHLFWKTTFLWMYGCPLCDQTNSVKALKETHDIDPYQGQTFHWPYPCLHPPPDSCTKGVCASLPGLWGQNSLEKEYRLNKDHDDDVNGACRDCWRGVCVPRQCCTWSVCWQVVLLRRNIRRGTSW